MPWQLKMPTFSFSLRPMLSKHWLVSTFLIWRKKKMKRALEQYACNVMFVQRKITPCIFSCSLQLSMHSATAMCFNLQFVNVTLPRAFPSPQKHQYFSADVPSEPTLRGADKCSDHFCWLKPSLCHLCTTQLCRTQHYRHAVSSTMHYKTTSSGAQLMHLSEKTTRPRSNVEHLSDSKVLLLQMLLGCIEPTEQQSTAQGWAASWGELWELGIFPALTTRKWERGLSTIFIQRKMLVSRPSVIFPNSLSWKAPFKPFCLTSPFCRIELQVFLRERQSLGSFNQRTKMKSDSKAHLPCLCLSFTKQSLPCLYFVFKWSKCKKEYSAFTTLPTAYALSDACFCLPRK